jgi:cytochrome b6-f complex iron-sulfur subunit
MGPLGIAVVVLVVLAGVFVFTSSIRRDRASATGLLSRETRRRDRTRSGDTDIEPVVTGRQVERMAVLERRGDSTALVPAAAAPPSPVKYYDEQTLGVTRRQFFNRGIVGLFTLGLAGFGGSVLAFLWPSLSGGFGSKITIGKLEDIKQKIKENRGFYYVAEGRLYMTEFPKDALDKARKIYKGAVLAGMEEGVNALYQKCVHLGCRVPECKASQWFECPCHGSKYNRVGEKKAGPAPRGLDRFGVIINNGIVSVDTSPAGLTLGPPIGTNTTGQEAEGPHCA